MPVGIREFGVLIKNDLRPYSLGCIYVKKTPVNGHGRAGKLSVFLDPVENRFIFIKKNSDYYCFQILNYYHHRKRVVMGMSTVPSQRAPSLTEETTERWWQQHGVVPAVVWCWSERQ